jgi:hypothetical protein
MWVPAVSGALVGAGFTLATVRGLRRRALTDGPPDPHAVSWTAPPLPIRQRGAVQAGFIAAHSLSTVALAGLALWDRARAGVGGALSPFALPSVALTWVWLLAGCALAYPLLSRHAGPVAVEVSSDGVAHGQFRGGWQEFSHFAADPATRVVRLYSPVLPGVPRGVWQPPSDDLYRAAVAILRGALPTRVADARRAGWRRSAEPILLVVAAAAPLLFGGVMAAGHRWGWVYYPLAAHALVWCAPAITRRYELD